MKTSVWIGVLWIGVFGLLASCSSGGGAPRSDVAPIAPYQLSETSRELLSEEPAVSAELERVLEEYFGAPGAPKMRRLPAWEETGFDPNGSPFDGVRPAFELSGLSLGVCVTGGDPRGTDPRTHLRVVPRSQMASNHVELATP